MDKRTVFADGLVLARSLKVLDRGVLVGEPPNVWLMRDTNGDLRMDTKELVTNQYGRLEGDPQNNANGFHWALDNRMYTAGQSDIQLRLKNGKFEVQKTLRRGEWGVTQDDAGRIYRNTNESALHVDLVPTAYFARNPNLLRTRGSYERLADDNYELNTVWPVRPNPGTNRAYQTGIDRPDGSLARFTSVCAPLVYRGDRLPAELYGNVFVAEPAANLVSRIVLEDDGTDAAGAQGVRARRVSRVDRRALPARLSVQCARRHAVHRRTCIAGSSSTASRSPMYLRDQILGAQAGAADRARPDLSRRARRRRGATPTPAAREGVAGATGRGALRIPTAGGATPRSGCSSSAALTVGCAGAREAGRERATDWRTRLHALWTLDGLDAIESGSWSQRSLTRRAKCGQRQSGSRSAGSASRTIRSRPPC